MRLSSEVCSAAGLESKISESYVRISTSIARGPFLKEVTRPTVASISLTNSSNSSGSKFVSI